ncbi:MAG: Tad domain-containing protein [Bacilli bacterium]
MLRLNNKGQSLVMFIVLIPIVLLVFTLVYDVGNAIYEKERLSNTNYMTIEYALDNINSVNENDLIELIMKNNSDLSSISVIIDNNVINIKISKNIRGIIGKMFDFDLIEARSEYVGELTSDGKKIERIK